MKKRREFEALRSLSHIRELTKEELKRFSYLSKKILGVKNGIKEVE